MSGTGFFHIQESYEAGSREWYGIGFVEFCDRGFVHIEEIVGGGICGILRCNTYDYGNPE